MKRVYTKFLTLPAVAHKILSLVYLMIRDGSRYREQGADYFDRMHPERTRNKLTQRLERLGFEVRLTPKNIPGKQLNC